MKKTLLIALIAGALALTACSGTPAASPETPAAKQIPSPSAEEGQRITDSLVAIVPGLDPERAVNNARNTCTGVLGGTNDQTLLKATATRFEGHGVEVVTTDQAQKILDVVKASEFCR